MFQTCSIFFQSVILVELYLYVPVTMIINKYVFIIWLWASALAKASEKSECDCDTLQIYYSDNPNIYQNFTKKYAIEYEIPLYTSKKINNLWWSNKEKDWIWDFRYPEDQGNSLWTTVNPYGCNFIC